jgi:paraquat-inducible protein A
MSKQPRAHQLGIVACGVCGLVLALQEEERSATCPRCRAPLHRRRGRGLAVTWFLLAAAILVFVSANLLPVMELQLLGQGEQHFTIIGGVLDLWRGESYGLAVVIFVASVGLPCAKFIVLGDLLLSVHGRSRFRSRQRARMHRLLELIGYWSMLDVLVVGILGSLVQFQALGEIDPGAGIFLFGASVILTMLAAHSFDARRIWDAAERGRTGATSHTGQATSRRPAP